MSTQIDTHGHSVPTLAGRPRVGLTRSAYPVSLPSPSSLPGSPRTHFERARFEKIWSMERRFLGSWRDARSVTSELPEPSTVRLSYTIRRRHLQSRCRSTRLRSSRGEPAPRSPHRQDRAGQFVAQPRGCSPRRYGPPLSQGARRRPSAQHRATVASFWPVGPHTLAPPRA